MHCSLPLYNLFSLLVLMLNDYLVYLEAQTTFSIYFDDKHGRP